jgi:probable F420-dependent oxidoreductase
MRPFRFAVQCSRTSTLADWRALARRCEDSGYSCLYIPDHFEDQFGPLVALTVAAEATTTLRVGSLVFDNDYRHPVVLAKEIATLDLASEGRVEFGLGAGWMTTDYDESGIPLDPPGVRVARMVEGLAIMKQLWASEAVSFAGEHYTITNAHGLPRPHSVPHPPIVIGGGSKRILSIAAREADIVGINPDLRAGYVGPEVLAKVIPTAWDERVGWVRDAAGARFDELDIQALTFLVAIGTPFAEAAPNFAPLLGIEPEALADVPLAMVGTVEEISDHLEARRARWGFNYIVVHEGELDAFAPVVDRLAGK